MSYGQADSLKIQRALNTATNRVSNASQRLASGLRINRASDDAAGLAISDSLNAKSRVFGQAIRNVSDGISVLSIASSAVEQMTDIVTRLKELAEQGSSGTYNRNQRIALDTEAQSLAAEYLRIARATEFNGTKVFDGTLASGLGIQSGIGEENLILSSLGGGLGAGALASGIASAAENVSIACGDLNGDGIIDVVSVGTNGTGMAVVQLGNGDGTFSAAVSYAMEATTTSAVRLADLNNDGVLDLVTSGSGASGNVNVRFGSGNGSFGSATSYINGSGTANTLLAVDINNDGLLDLVTGGYYTGTPTLITRLNQGNGTFGSAITTTFSGSSLADIGVGDFNRDGVLDIVAALGTGGMATAIGNGSGGFGTPSVINSGGLGVTSVEVGDLDGDGDDDFAAEISDHVKAFLNTGSGSFATGVTAITASGATLPDGATLSLADLNGDGLPDLSVAGTAAGSGYVFSALNRGAGTFNSTVSYAIFTSAGADFLRAITYADVNGDGATDFLVSGTSNGADSIGAVLNRLQDGINALQDFSLKTMAGSRQALSAFSVSLTNLLAQQGKIGAAQSRLEQAYQVASTHRDANITALSRIRDVDVAEESAELLRSSIVQQAAVSILAQANNEPRLAQLLLS